MRNRTHILTLVLETAVGVLALLGMWSCQKEPTGYKDTIYEDRKVMILYLAGHNSLSDDIQKNITSFLDGTDFHSNDADADAVLIFCHSEKDNAVPHLLYPHKDSHGDIVTDTLITFSSNTKSATAQTLSTVLTYIRDNFPADEYGLVFSSHGTGYLPAGYYTGSSNLESSYTTTTGANKIQKKNWTYLEPEPVPGIYDWDPMVKSPDTSDGGPTVKSAGQDYYSKDETYEIEIQDFADAIPMKLKYVVFDACLMGGIEVAYQLRDKVEWLIASPTEILSTGMDYATMASYLMARPEDDLEGFCESYYNLYIVQSGDYQSATISLTDCTQLEPLAQLCGELFSKYRDALDNISHNDIQQYYRYSYHWFFDIGDIVEHLGCTDEELERFNALMDVCVPYKAATESFMNSSMTSTGFDITHFSGLSMILPNYAGEYLKNYYRNNLDWNDATGLVE